MLITKQTELLQMPHTRTCTQTHTHTEMQSTLNKTENIKNSKLPSLCSVQHSNTRYDSKELTKFISSLEFFTYIGRASEEDLWVSLHLTH